MRSLMKLLALVPLAAQHLADNVKDLFPSSECVSLTPATRKREGGSDEENRFLLARSWRLAAAELPGK